MTRTNLSLYELDRPALKKVSAELEAALMSDDAVKLAELLELGDAMRDKLHGRERLVDHFLLPAEHHIAKPLFASLRRISKKRALSKVMTSSDAALEGRLRGYELLRNNAQAAKLIDKLINPKRLPWYLRVDGATCGWLNDEQRKDLISEMKPLRGSLTPELVEFVDALEDCVADAVMHDML